MTESGVEEAEKSHVSIKARQERLRSLSRSPETASIVSVFSNSAMALLKLVAGFLFNSMARERTALTVSWTWYQRLRSFWG